VHSDYLCVFSRHGTFLQPTRQLGGFCFLGGKRMNRRSFLKILGCGSILISTGVLGQACTYIGRSGQTLGEVLEANGFKIITYTSAWRKNKVGENPRVCLPAGQDASYMDHEHQVYPVVTWNGRTPQHSPWDDVLEDGDSVSISWVTYDPTKNADDALRSRKFAS